MGGLAIASRPGLRLNIAMPEPAVAIPNAQTVGMSVISAAR
jgi:hypothetical protein